MSENVSRRPGQLSVRWAALADEVRRRLGPGVPLAPSERAVIAQPLDSVLRPLVHRSAIGGRLVRAVNADALSIGEHVVGGHAALDDSTRGGHALLAHELTHVAYRSGAHDVAVQRASGDSADPEEAMAQHVEASALSAPAESPTGDGAPVDLDALTERVYRRIIQELLVEQERAAHVA